MDKKAKHKLDVLHQKLQKLRLQLSGAKKQVDEPDEVSRLEKEIAAVNTEVEQLKKA